MHQKRLWKRALTLLAAGGCALTVVTTANADIGTELWNSTYYAPDGYKFGVFSGIGFHPDGTLLATGHRSEPDSDTAVAIRYDAVSGAALDNSPVEWILYPSLADFDPTWTDYTGDRFFAQFIEADGDIYLAGRGRNDGGSRVWDPVLVKYNKADDNTSERMWEKRYTPNSTQHGLYAGVAANAAGDIYAAGYFGRDAASAVGNDWFVHKFDSSGAEATGFPLTYDFNALDDGIEDIAIDSDGNFIVAGYVTVDATTDHRNWFVRKYSGDGTQVLWEENYDHNGLNDNAYFVTLDSEDNVIVSGYVNNGTAVTADNDWYIVKYTKSGDGSGGATKLWEQSWDIGNTSGMAYGMATDSQDNVYIVGSQINGSGPYRSYVQYRDGQTGALLKLQELSHTVTQNNNPTAEHDYMKRITLNGNQLVVAGFTWEGYVTYGATARVAMFDILDTYDVSTGILDADCSDGKCNLQAALSAAALNNGINVELHLQAGTYTGNFVYSPTTVNYGSLTLLGGYSADFFSRTLDPTNTILDGGGSESVLQLNPGIAAGTTAVNGSLMVEGITVTNGNAAIGGGILALTLPPGTIELTNNIIENNNATETGGGCAVAVWDFVTPNGGEILFSNNIVRNNTVFITDGIDGNGGGCSFIVSGLTSLTNNLFYNNSVGDSNAYDTPDGGGIDFDLLAGELSLINNTITANQVLGQSGSTAAGGGISLGTDGIDAWAGTAVELVNNIIYSNSVSSGLGDDIHNRVISAGVTLGSSLTILTNDYDGYFKSADSGTVDPVLANNIDLDPLFSVVPASLYQLTSTSPCIDIDTAINAPNTDLAGVTRPQGTHPDLGCYEFVNTATVYTLTASVSGGNGTISPESGRYYAADNIIETLTASPDSNYHVDSWTGTDDDTSTATTNSVTMDSDKVVTVTIAIDQYLLTVATAGTGSGTVTSVPAGIDCGVDCSVNYDYGTEVTLTATPATGSSFTSWSGDAGCSDGIVTMDAAKSCTATFTLIPYPLTVTKTGAGTGTVTSAPVGIDCGVDCTEDYDYGTGVTLAPAADPDSTFAGWSGDADCSDGIVTIDAARNCTAAFALMQYSITTTVLPGAGGGVSCEPNPVDHWSTSECTITTSPGYTLNSVNGSCGGTLTNDIYTTGAITADCLVAATFDINMYTLGIVFSGLGTGTVTSAPAGIDGCITNCSADFSYNTVVTLTAAADEKSKFIGWSGAGCTGTGDCTVTIDQAREITATFASGFPWNMFLPAILKAGIQ